MNPPTLLKENVTSVVGNRIADVEYDKWYKAAKVVQVYSKFKINIQITSQLLYGIINQVDYIPASRVKIGGYNLTTSKSIDCFIGDEGYLSILSGISFEDVVEITGTYVTA